MIKFMYPYFICLLLLPVLFRFITPCAKGIHGDALKIPFVQDIKNIVQKNKFVSEQNSGKLKSDLMLYFLYFIWALLTLSSMRPVLLGEPYKPKNFGHEIMMVLDISTSMLEQDYAVSGHRTSRINAVKLAAYDFLEKRKNDKIGLVLFGTRAYLQAPPTFDRESVKDVVLDMQPGMAGRSTSIGDAIGIATKALDNPENKDIPKIIILLTDGENNDGSISLEQAVQLAKQNNIKIYTIGVGNEKSLFQAFLSSYTSFKTSDENSELKSIAEETNGQYFKAQDTSSLLKVYEMIDKLEAQENDANYIQETKELYYIPLLAAILFATALMILKRINYA